MLIPRRLLLFIICTVFTVSSWAADGVIEVPFDFYHNSVIIEVRIGGKGPFNMLLDTGVDPSIIDLGTAKELGLQVATTGQPGSGGGTDTNLAYETELPLVELRGGLRAEHVAAVAADLSKTSAALGKPLQGVLGYSLLKDRVVQFDYPKHLVRFYDHSRLLTKGPRAGEPKALGLPFRYKDEILIDGVTVNGQRMTANLDTGSNAYFQLTPAAVAALGLEKEISQAPAGHSTGINGIAGNRQGKVRNVTIGEISIDEPDVVFYDRGTGHDEESWGIRLGNAFLKDFSVTIDYQNMTITLQKP